MKIVIAATTALLLSTGAFAQDTVNNPAISAETVETLNAQIKSLEAQIVKAGTFVTDRSPDLLDLNQKIKFADEDTQRIIDDLKALVATFKTGSEIQVAVQDSMQDVKGYIDDFREGSDAQKKAAESLIKTLKQMEDADAKRDELVAEALGEIRRLEAMKGDLVALKIAGAFKEMADLYDKMVKEFGDTVAETKATADAIQSMTQLPVQ